MEPPQRRPRRIERHTFRKPPPHLDPPQLHRRRHHRLYPPQLQRWRPSHLGAAPTHRLASRGLGRRGRRPGIAGYRLSAPPSSSLPVLNWCADAAPRICRLPAVLTRRPMGRATKGPRHGRRFPLVRPLPWQLDLLGLKLHHLQDPGKRGAAAADPAPSRNACSCRPPAPPSDVQVRRTTPSPS